MRFGATDPADLAKQRLRVNALCDDNGNATDLPDGCDVPRLTVSSQTYLVTARLVTLSVGRFVVEVAVSGFLAGQAPRVWQSMETVKVYLEGKAKFDPVTLHVLKGMSCGCCVGGFCACGKTLFDGLIVIGPIVRVHSIETQ